MTVDRTRNDLDRFRWTCPAWWAGFNKGRQSGRDAAIAECADWREGDFQLGKAAEILEGVET